MIDKKNTEMHSSLFELQKELNDLKSAKQQIEEIFAIANNVIVGVDILKDEYQNHFLDLKTDYSEKLKLFEKTLVEIQNRLEISYKNSEKLSQDYLNDSQSKVVDFLRKQSEETEKSQLHLMTTTKKLISDLIQTLNDSVYSSKIIYENQNEKIIKHLDVYNDFVIIVENLINSIKKIDFPSRLDKIDNTISGINIGIQNLQTKIIDIEKTLYASILKNEEIINTNFIKMNTHNKKTNRKVMIVLLVNVFLSIGLLIKIFF